MPYFNGRYLTDSEVAQISNRLHGDELDHFRSNLSSGNGGGSFVDSAIIGAVTGSALLGGILGGSFLGGFVGDELAGDDDFDF